jgi:hypothetical protein
MNGQHLVFHKEHYNSGKFVWRCYSRATYGHEYSNTKDWIDNAENAMRGSNDVLWRKVDEQAPVDLALNPSHTNPPALHNRL